jgi:virginiamycin B lyase
MSTVAVVGSLSGAPLSADPLSQITVVATGGSTPGFSPDGRPGGITTGPDGNLWFLETGGNEGLVRMTPAGEVTEFPVPGGGIGFGLALNEITTGPDGNLWFTGFQPPGYLFKATTDGAVTTVLQGTVTPGFPNSNVQDITAGPDGNLWVTLPFSNPDDELMQVTPAGVFTTFGSAAGLPLDATLRGITVGPDGDLWITDSGQGVGEPPVPNRIWRFDIDTGTFHLMATAGTTPGFTAGTSPGEIILGPDGNLWYEFGSATHSGIGRITPAGVVTQFTDGFQAGALLEHLAVGCDDAIWAAQSPEDDSDSQIVRITTAGAVTSYTTGLPADSGMVGITEGPDEQLYATNRFDPGGVVRVGAGCGGPLPPPTPAPVVVTPTFTG